jgi:hypothetical protein
MDDNSSLGSTLDGSEDLDYLIDPFSHQIEDAVAFAQALTNPRLTSVRFYSLPFSGHECPYIFLTTLTAGLPSMRNLEALDVDIFDETFLRTTALCPCLKRLRLYFNYAYEYTEKIDQALAQCLLDGPGLEDIELSCTSYDNSWSMHSCPALLEDAKLCYTIQNIRLVKTPIHGELPLWYDELTTSLEMVCRLNRAGRCYMVNDCGDRSEGHKVLGDVNDDLNCLYFHLRENPVLCERQLLAATSSLPTKTGRKRKGEHNFELEPRQDRLVCSV